jgi:hypothetical protein
MSLTLKMVDGDLYVDAAGRYLAIEGMEKCAQDLAESLLNNRDPEFPPWYPGSELYRLTNGEYLQLLSHFTPMELIQTYVEDAVDRLIELQDIDAEVDDDEAITEILMLDVRPIGNLTWAFWLIVQVDTNEPVKMGFTVDLKQQLPAAIRGDLPDTFGPNTPDAWAKTFM